jgi:hypothetical protein
MVTTMLGKADSAEDTILNNARRQLSMASARPGGRLELKMVVDDEHCHVQHRRLVLSRCESDARPRGCAAILLVQYLKCSIFSVIGLQLQIIYIKTMNSCETKVDMGNGVSVV